MTSAEQPTCIACDHHTTEPPALLCDHCTTQLRDHLDELGRTHPRLDPTPGSSGSNGGRGIPGFGSRSPARDDVLNLTDRRRQTVDSGQWENVGGTLPTLLFWLDTAIVEGVIPITVGPGAWSVERVCGVLRLWCGRLAEQWWAADMLAAVGAAVGHVRRALGTVEPTVVLGACPVLPDPLLPLWEVAHAELTPRLARAACDALLAEWGCGGQVRARAFGQTARCNRCGAGWSTLAELRTLGEQLGDALLDLPGLARYLDVPVSTITTWAQRDRWEKRGARGRRLYRLSEARASFARRRLTAAEVAA